MLDDDPRFPAIARSPAAPHPRKALPSAVWALLLCLLVLSGPAAGQSSAEEPTPDEAAFEEDEASRATAFNLTRSIASDRRPAFSPDGTQIVFESNRDGNWELYLMDRKGWHQQRLTVHPAADRSASFSPDGGSLVFQSTRGVEGRASDIFLLTLSPVGSPTRLTDHEADDAFPRFSPDGTKIVFTSSRHGNADIFSMNADGSGVLRLTDHEANDAWASFSGDGKKIVFFSQRDGNDEIYQMNADGSGLERLTEHEANDFVPRFDPSSNRIVFASNRRGEDQPQLFFLEPGRDELLLELKDPGRATEPAFSPDGRFLAFVTNRDGNDEIYLLSLPDTPEPAAVRGLPD